MRGALEKTPLAHVFVHALDKKLSGSLVLSHADGRSAVLLLAEGRIAKAKTSEPVAHLGRVLLELGHVTSNALDQSLVTLAKKRGLHGKLLVESGIITETQLRHGLRVQLLRKLQHCFSFPPESTFGFFEGFDLMSAIDGGDVPPVDPLPAIWRGVCAAPSWTHVDAALSRLGDAPFRLVSSAEVQRFLFEDDVASAVDLLRVQPIRLEELVASGLLSAKMAKLLAYCLFLTKQLVPAEATSRAASAPGAPPSSSVSARPGSVPPPARPSNAPVRITLKPPSISEPPTSTRMAVKSAWPDTFTRPEPPSDRLAALGGPADHATLYRKAEACAAQRDFEQAEVLCRRAHEAAPKEAKYLALLAWAESRRPDNAASKPLADILAMLDRAIALDGCCERAFYFRALLHKQHRREALAARDFRRAAELDPSNADAVREMLAHEKRGKLPR